MILASERTGRRGGVLAPPRRRAGGVLVAQADDDPNAPRVVLDDIEPRRSLGERLSDSLYRTGQDELPFGILDISPAGGAPVGPVRPSPGNRERARLLGYGDERFYRGEPGAPRSYPGGSWFSRDKGYSDAFAKKGGNAEAREFRLRLPIETTWDTTLPLPADHYARVIKALRAGGDTRLADDMAEQIAPGQGADWFIEFARRNPQMVVADESGAAILLQALDRSSSGGMESILRLAGFDAINTPRDVRKLTGAGIRHKDAEFDPVKAESDDIYSSLPSPGRRLA